MVKLVKNHIYLWNYICAGKTFSKILFLSDQKVVKTFVTV